MIGTYDLNPDRQSLVAEASRHCECRTTRHGDGKHAFHPFVVGFHLLASDLLRPMGVYVEWKELGCGNNEEVILFEKSSHGVIPFRAHDGGARIFKGGGLRALLAPTH